MFFYFWVSVPIIMLLYSMISFGALSMNYQCKLRRRIFICVLIYCILFLAELLSAAITGYIHFPLNETIKYSSIAGIIINQIICLTFVNLLRSYKSKSQIDIPMAYWISIILTPIVSIYFLVVIMDAGVINRIEILFMIVILLAVNFANVYIYNFIVESMVERTNQLLLEQQNKYIQNHLDMMENMIKIDRSFKHDLKNHLLSLELYLRHGNIDEALQYVAKMQDYEKNENKSCLVSNNSIIDSVLNLKMKEAEKKGIQIVSEICVPSNLTWNDFDATVLLCNILDNAMEATQKAFSKCIRVQIKYNRKRLMVKSRNTYDGKIYTRGGMLITNKHDKHSHGIGMQNIKNVVEKYNGIMKINYDDSWFEIIVVLYV